MRAVSITRLLSFAALCLFAAALPLQAAPNDVVISSATGNFSITLPQGFKTPEYTMNPISTEVGEITTMNYISYSDLGACMVGVSQYPDKLAALISQKQKEVLQGAQAGALRNMDATLIRQEEYTLNGNPGRTLWFRSMAEGQPLYGQMRLICAMPRLYHILYLTDQEGNLQSSGVQGYFGSFQLLK